MNGLQRPAADEVDGDAPVVGGVSHRFFLPGRMLEVSAAVDGPDLPALLCRGTAQLQDLAAATPLGGDGAVVFGFASPSSVVDGVAASWPVASDSEGEYGVVEAGGCCGHGTSSGSSSVITHMPNTVQLVLSHALQSPTARQSGLRCPVPVAWSCDLSVTSVTPSR